MSTFYRWPCPERGEFNRKFGGIVEALRNYSRLLPKFGWDEVNSEQEADLVVGHLGTTSKRLDAFHLHGLYPTGEPQFGDMNFQGNLSIIDNLRRARTVVAVSDWVADIVRRDMHVRPYVLGHGFDYDKWQEIPRGAFLDKPFALWNKTRSVGVCDPQPVIELAKRFPNFQFVTTFVPRGIAEPSNVGVTGIVEHQVAWRMVRDCSVYLATTKETFGISTLEAMASGVPVVGFGWGATPEVLGDAGILVEPGNYDALASAFQAALKYKDELGERGRERVQELFSWERTVERLGEIYDEILVGLNRKRPKVTLVIPCFNYSRYVERAIWCAAKQTLQDVEIIIVDDGSQDGSVSVIEKALRNVPNGRLIRQKNAGVAHARNRGIAEGTGEYICCLDADDGMAPSFLEKCVRALDADSSLAIAYTGLQTIDHQDHVLSNTGHWPEEYNPGLWPGKNQVPTCCVYRRDFWERLGGYRQRFAPKGAGQEDADLWLRILANGGNALKVSNDNLFYYRIHQQQTTRVHKSYWHERHYLGWYPFVNDGQYPFASRIGKPEKATWPVRNYDQPKVSVIVPVGPKHVHYLPDALDSIEAQTMRKWELIVVNDSGQPLNLEPWSFARVVDTGGGKGAGFARNRGTEIMRAPKMTYLDADDILQPGYLAWVLDAWEQADGKRWVYTDLFILHEDGKAETYEIQDWNVEKLWRSGLAAVTCLYSKEMWAQVGGFDEDLVGREDWDFHLRLAMAGYCGVHMPVNGFTYRHGTGFRRKEGQFLREIKILQEKYPGKELEMASRGCGGCGRAKSSAHVDTWDLKSAKSNVAMEYTGPGPDRSYRGRTGRIYRVGSRQNNRFWAHPADVDHLLKFSFFKRAVVTEAGEDKGATLQIEPKPKPVSVVSPVEQKAVEPEIEPVQSLPDPSGMKVKEIKGLDLEPEEWLSLLEKERAGKARTTAVAFMEAQVDGTSKHAYAAVPG